MFSLSSDWTPPIFFILASGWTNSNFGSVDFLCSAKIRDFAGSRETINVLKAFIHCYFHGKRSSAVPLIINTTSVVFLSTLPSFDYSSSSSIQHKTFPVPFWIFLSIVQYFAKLPKLPKSLHFYSAALHSSRSFEMAYSVYDFNSFPLMDCERTLSGSSLTSIWVVRLCFAYKASFLMISSNAIPNFNGFSFELFVAAHCRFRRAWMYIFTVELLYFTLPVCAL